MGKPRLAAVASVCASSLALAPASQAGRVGPDPGSNLSVRPLCAAGPRCLAQAVQYLDQARQHLGEAPYQLPSDFAGLNPAEQAFVLTNLDRIQHGLRPIGGFDQPAESTRCGRRSIRPRPRDERLEHLDPQSNWAGGYVDLPLTYEAWMYDDGPGSDNLDCPTAGPSGCWGHRHAVLWRFGSGPLAMGAAAGLDAHGIPGSSMLIEQGTSSYRPT
jgi:hypothetical protein